MSRAYGLRLVYRGGVDLDGSGFRWRVFGCAPVKHDLEAPDSVDIRHGSMIHFGFQWMWSLEMARHATRAESG